MKTPFLTLTAAAFVLAAGSGPTQAQQSSGGQAMQPDQQGQQGGMMGPGMMGPGMMEPGMGPHMDPHMDPHMGPHMGRHMGRHLGHGTMMRILFAIMDADGDGAVSLAEVQEIHARIFAHMDADGDGKVTPDEISDFFHGTRDVWRSSE
ncbi:MAG TPA: EF-hand domain-containing protein [Thermohalobaculum sp.]|nr:EF-hand domain-containing protein [Thermohalobaculum sp.]